uniref:Protein kinase domain-containing protein n=1 Tax=Dunaliella tertiolecta TaxID=3047 RepID=A0A7S3VR62_DUNTE
MTGPESPAQGQYHHECLPKLSASEVVLHKWSAAGSKIVAANKVSPMFETLRDQKQVNELDPSRLKLIKVLGEGAFATVNLCELLPGVQLDRSLSSPADPDEKVPAQQNKDGHHAEQQAGRGQLVAVKCLKPGTSMPVDDLDSFIQEAALTRKLKHKYIVDYIGVGFMDSSSEGSKQKTMFITQEFMAGGTLKSMVSKQMLSPNRTVYSDQQALQWSHQLAEALAYLHSAIPMVIHRDLKLENVLLTSEEQTPGGQVAKLADFGLVAFVRKKARKNFPAAGPASTQDTSQQKEQQELMERARAAMQHMGTLGSRSSLKKLESLGGTSTKKEGPSLEASKSSRLQSRMLDPPEELSGQTGSFMYMSPEMFKSEAYNEKVDVFSFGVMMYELFHRYLMICAISNAGTLEEIVNYARQISNGYRPPIGERWPPEFRKLLTDCMAQDAKDRPAMSEVAERLKVMLKKGTLDGVNPTSSSCCVLS